MQLYFVGIIENVAIIPKFELLRLGPDPPKIPDPKSFYRLAKKYCPFVYIEFTKKIGQDFFYIQYNLTKWLPPGLHAGNACPGVGGGLVHVHRPYAQASVKPSHAVHFAPEEFQFNYSVHFSLLLSQIYYSQVYKTWTQYTGQTEEEFFIS